MRQPRGSSRLQAAGTTPTPNRPIGVLAPGPLERQLLTTCSECVDLSSSSHAPLASSPRLTVPQFPFEGREKGYCGHRRQCLPRSTVSLSVSCSCDSRFDPTTVQPRATWPQSPAV